MSLYSYSRQIMTDSCCTVSVPSDLITQYILSRITLQCPSLATYFLVYLYKGEITFLSWWHYLLGAAYRPPRGPPRGPPRPRPPLIPLMGGPPRPRDIPPPIPPRFMGGPSERNRFMGGPSPRWLGIDRRFSMSLWGRSSRPLYPPDP